MSKKIGFRKQRGFWLRCFLGGTVWMLLCARAATLEAQLELPGPERLTHVEGVVVDDAGHPMVDVKVTLSRDGKVLFETRTDKSGQFRFGRVSGQFVFRVARTQYAPAERQIVVTDEIVTALERKKLYVIAGPGACQDPCSSVLANKREFDREIRKMTKH